MSRAVNRLGYDSNALAIGTPVIGGTANCVLYIDAAGNAACDASFIYNGADHLSIGRPAFTGWIATWSVIQLGATGGIAINTASGDYLRFSENGYYPGGANWKYIEASQAASYSLGQGTHLFSIAPTGAAGGNITFTQVVTIPNFTGGGLSVGKTAWENWGTTESIIQLGGNSALRTRLSEGVSNYFILYQNAYRDAGNVRYISADEASYYSQSHGGHYFFIAPSGVADAIIAWGQAFTIFNQASGQVFIGKTTRENWDPNASVLLIGGYAAIAHDVATAVSQSLRIVNNAYDNGGWTYVISDEATLYLQDNGQHRFYVAPTGVAGNPISWTLGVDIDNDGVLKSLRGRIVNERRITGATTLDAQDHVIMADSDGGAFTVTLPAGVNGTEYKITNCGSSGNNVTVDGDGAETINGALTHVLADGESIVIIFQNTEDWRIF